MRNIAKNNKEKAENLALDNILRIYYAKNHEKRHFFVKIVKISFLGLQY